MRDTELLEEVSGYRDWHMANGSKVTGKLLNRIVLALEAEYAENERLGRDLQNAEYGVL